MCKRQLIELSAQAHTEGAYRFAADMQLEQEIIKIWGRLIMEGQNLDLTEYFLPDNMPEKPADTISEVLNSGQSTASQPLHRRITPPLYFT